MPPLLSQLGGKHFVLCGNGAMIEELAAALSDVGVAQQLVYEEPYFNGRHVARTGRGERHPGPLRGQRPLLCLRPPESSLFVLEKPLGDGDAGNVDPSAPSDVFGGPEFLSHVARAG